MGGWTRTPNFILDAIPDMSAAEVQIVMAIVRQTIGWQREEISLTVSEFEKLTNMARASVVAGIRDALKRGTIKRREDGKSFVYRIAEPECDTPSVQNLNCHEAESVQNMNSSDDPSVQNMNSKEPESVQNLDRSSVQNMNSIKRNINTNKPEKENSVERTPGQEMYAAVCEAMGWDYKIIPERDKGDIAETVLTLTKANYTVVDIRRFMVEIWFRDWRWEKRKQRPTLEQIRQEIGKLRAGVPEQVPRTSPSQPTSRVAASLAAIDEYERIKASHGVTT